MNGNSLIADLARASLDGALMDCNHVQYDRLRRVNNGLIDRRPAAIVRALSTTDVQKIVRVAAEREALLAVRCGGHSFPGLSTCDDGIVLDLSMMNNVVADPDARTIDVAGGALLGDVDAAGLRYGLVTPAGVVSHTGVGGLTLGGGMGWLSRRLGLTIDNLLGADIVTADGRLIRTSADEEPDLFWAIRGGGGNYGVVTKFRFRLHELGPTFVGRWAYPVKEAPSVLARYREAANAARRELTTMIVFTSSELRITALWSGSSQGAEDALAVFGTLGAPNSASISAASFLELQRASDERMAWGRRYYAKGGFLHAIDDATIAVLTEALAAAPSPDSEVYILQLGGAVCDVDESATPYPGRAARHYWIVEGVWDDPGIDPACIAWGRNTASRLAANSLKANYINEQSDTGVAQGAYGEEKYNQLAQIKWRYDPSNLFRLNQNIEPRRS